MMDLHRMPLPGTYATTRPQPIQANAARAHRSLVSSLYIEGAPGASRSPLSMRSVASSHSVDTAFHVLLLYRRINRKIDPRGTAKPGRIVLPPGKAPNDPAGEVKVENGSVAFAG